MDAYGYYESLYGMTVINDDEIDTDMDPDYTADPAETVDHPESDTLLDWQASLMAKSKRRGNDGKKRRKKQKPKVQTFGKATAGSANAGSTVKPKPPTPKKSYDPYDDWDYGWGGAGGGVGGYMVGKCRHYNSVDTPPFMIQGVPFYPSSMNNQRKDDDLIPDWGLYLDWGWKHPDWRAENLDWRDYGLPSNYTVAFAAFVDVIERAQRGEKVEIGCIGGHGRTGTALACIAVILGMTSKDAISHVRTNYCSHTLETDEQEWFVEWVEAQMNGTEAPAKPERKVQTYTYKAKTGTTTVSKATPKPAYCSVYDHFYMWLRGAQHCGDKGSKCSTYPTHTKQWLEKGVPGYILNGKDIEWHRTQAQARLKHPKSSSYGSTSTQVTKAKEAKKDDDVLPALHKMKKPGKRIVQKYYAPFDGSEEHEPGMPSTCQCDPCRYLRTGHGGFLEPSNWKEGGKEYIDRMNNLETVARERVKARQQATPPPLPQAKDTKTIKMFTQDKGIIEVIVNPRFPAPPPRPGGYANEHINNWVWDADSSQWVYKLPSMKG